MRAAERQDAVLAFCCRAAARVMQICPESPEEERDKGNQYTKPRQYPRAAGRGRRQTLRGLGDGPHRGQGQPRHLDHDREKHQLPAHGETQAWEERHAGG